MKPRTKINGIQCIPKNVSRSRSRIAEERRRFVGRRLYEHDAGHVIGITFGKTSSTAQA